MKVNTPQREILRQLKRMTPAQRLDERDYIALLLPYGFPVTSQVESLAVGLGATVVVVNSWPDRLCRPHQRVADEGADVTGPCLYIERFTQEVP